ncbi:hypothetical protein ACFL57_02680 [Candidatus Margulisiibacteriota bacterium]
MLKTKVINKREKPINIDMPEVIEVHKTFNYFRMLQRHKIGWFCIMGENVFQEHDLAIKNCEMLVKGDQLDNLQNIDTSSLQQLLDARIWLNKDGARGVLDVSLLKKLDNIIAAVDEKINKAMYRIYMDWCPGRDVNRLLGEEGLKNTNLFDKFFAIKRLGELSSRNANEINQQLSQDLPDIVFYIANESDFCIETIYQAATELLNSIHPRKEDEKRLLEINEQVFHDQLGKKNQVLALIPLNKISEVEGLDEDAKETFNLIKSHELRG